MTRTYRHLMQSDGGHLVQEVRADGQARIVSPDHPTYLAWLAAGGLAEVVAYVAPQPPSLEAIKAAKVAEITEGCQVALAALASEYCPMERQTWDQQALEAAALHADPNASAPLVRAMATARGVTVEYLVERILANSQTWKVIAGPVLGRRQALWTAVSAITDETPGAVAAVQAVEVTYSLPGA